MQSCSVHHCVLFLLTLTLTTDPGSASCVFPFYATLHQSVTLPCETQCSGRAKWSLDSNREVVFAQCDQTSCRSEQKGFNMSYDRFKKGDLSLTITNPDYSVRKSYTCECDFSDYATARLRISTVFSAVQMSPKGDLKLDVSVPESVEVIYRGSVLADDVHICNVTQRSLQCKSEYTPRTSLSYPELTLTVWRGESGTYTIRNLDYKEDIRVYDVSVSGLTPGETAGIVIVVLILLLLIAGVVYYMWRKPEQKRRQVIRDKEAVYKLTIQALNNPVGEMEEVEEKINALQKKYRGDSQYSGVVGSFCEQMRLVLSLWKNLSRTQLKSLDPLTARVNRDMIAVDDLIKEVPLRRAGEVEAKLEEVEKKINDLNQKYGHNSEYKQHVYMFCYIKGSELYLCRNLYGTQNAVTGEVKNRMVSVNDLMKQVKRSPTGEVVKAMLTALQETNKLKLDYMESREYSHHITSFCILQRIEIDSYIKFYEAQIEKQDNEPSEYANVSELGEEDRSLMKRVERAAKIFKELKDEETSKRHFISSEQLNEMFNHVDKHLWCINSWYETKMMELSRYKEVLPAQAPKAPRNTAGEESRLLAFT